jgi:hypothetical protein
LLIGCFGALFSFQNEAPPLVEVDPSPGMPPGFFQNGKNSISLANAILPILEIYGPLEDVRILLWIISCGIWSGNVDEVAEVLQEQAVIGTLGTTSGFPASFKFRKSHRISYFNQVWINESADRL